MVGTDYFSKWVETKPLANIRDVDVKKFVWKNIVTRSGSLVPLSRIMAFNSIAKLSRDTVAILALRIDIPPQLIPKGMDKLRLSTKS